MTTLFRIPAVLALAIGLVACASSGFRADVTRFHADRVPVPEGQLVTIRPAADKDDGLQFQEYAMILGRAFGEIGFRPAAGKTPDLVVRLDWDRRPLPREGGGSDTRIGIGVGSYGRRSGVSLGTSFGLGDSDGDGRDYSHELFVTLEDGETGDRLWEGRARTRSQTSNTGTVLPYLARALLKDFPGTGGQTERVEIPLED